MTRHSQVFTAAEARRAGFGRNEIPVLLRSGAWWRLRHGVYTTGAIWREHESTGRTHTLDCAAVLRRLGGSTVAVSHTSAARVHDLLLPNDARTEVQLTDPDQFRCGPGYRIHEASLASDDVVIIAGLRVTSLVRTLIDVAREWDVIDAVVAMDDALADGRVTHDELVAAVHAQSHWPGISRAAQAAHLARVGAHSPHETRTRLAWLAAGLPEPQLQAAVLHGRRLVAVLDMLWADAGVFADCDGKVKYQDPWQQRTPADVAWAEKSRNDDLVDLDLRGVRMKPADLFAPLSSKVARVRTLLATPSPAPRQYRIEPWKAGLRTPPRVSS